MDHLVSACSCVRARRARARVTAPRQLHSFFFRIIVARIWRATTGVRLCARVRLTWTWLVWRALTGLNDLLRIWQTASAVTQTGCEALRTWREWQWLTSAALHASSTSTLLSPLNGVSVNESSATISCSDPLCWEAAVSPPFPLCLPRAHTHLSPALPVRLIHFTLSFGVLCAFKQQ